MEDKLLEKFSNKVFDSHSAINQTVSNFGKEVIELKKNVSNIQTKMDTAKSMLGYFGSILSTLLLLMCSILIYIFNDYKDSDSARAAATDKKVVELSSEITSIGKDVTVIKAVLTSKQLIFDTDGTPTLVNNTNR